MGCLFSKANILIEDAPYRPPKSTTTTTYSQCQNKSNYNYFPTTSDDYQDSRRKQLRLDRQKQESQRKDRDKQQQLRLEQRRRQQRIYEQTKRRQTLQKQRKDKYLQFNEEKNIFSTDLYTKTPQQINRVIIRQNNLTNTTKNPYFQISSEKVTEKSPQVYTQKKQNPIRVKQEENKLLPEQFSTAFNQRIIYRDRERNSFARNEQSFNTDQSIKVETYYQKNSLRLAKFQEQAQETQTDNEQQIKNLILSYHKGNKNNNQYTCEQRLKIFDNFYNQQKYVRTLKELLKYEIIQDINKRLEEKQQENFQRQIKVKCSKISENYFHKADKKLKNKYKNCISATGVEKNDINNLEQSLLKGEKLGILTNTLPFKIHNFSKSQTYLCFLRRQNGSKFAIIDGIDDQSISEQMYLIDLDPIISHLREYSALQQIGECNLIQQLLGSKPSALRGDYQERSWLLNSETFKKISTLRNPSQIAIIKQFSQKERGIYLIQGPPGTGKTQTITNFVSLEYDHACKLNGKQYNKQNVIMICAQSNAAINHITRKIVKEGLLGNDRNPRVLRLGQSEQFDETILSVSLSHLCQTTLMKSLGYPLGKQVSSAKLRYEKQLKLDQINKVSGTTNRYPIKALKKQVQRIVEQLVEIKNLIQEHWQKYMGIEDQFLRQCEILLSTLNTSGKYKYREFFKGKVMTLIIDQSGQATEPSTLVPFQCNPRKVILVGDHKQLPPTVMSKNAKKTKYNRSLFERFIDNGVQPLLLDTQYRMVSELRKYPSFTFYNDELKDGRHQNVPESLRHMRSASWFIDVSYGREEIVKKSQQNTSEADVVMFLIDKLFMKDKNISIGVIAPYQSQIKCIETMVEKKQYDKNLLKVSTVDAFQGQERDVIIMTCVRSNNNGDIGFVRCQKRMNVSITRAKYALFVIGHESTLNKSQKNFNYWRGYIDEHKKKNTFVSSGNHQEAQSVIRSILSNTI